MKSIINTLLFLGGIVLILAWLGLIDTDQILDMLAGEVTVGETEQIFDESEFMKRFDMIVGEVEVNDTSRTAIERNSAFCQKGYVVTTTHAMIKYEVQTTEDLFYIDGEKKEYYISPDLGVNYIDAGKETATAIIESNCIKERHITPQMIENAKQLAAKNFNNAVESSDKIIEARAEFERIKQTLIDDFENAGFTSVPPENRLLN